ncbi:MAG: efflux RND transporter permease subunit [Muribaculaceae bacterium]|nr:efflux RND transporter permease subunit [Muribaculaceae bacterium]
MFQKLIEISIRNKLVILTMTGALIVWGLWSLYHLPFDSTPDITNNQVQIVTQAPSLGAQEVEMYITTPLEMAFANIPRVIERRSISRSGLSVLTLVFEDDADVYWARQQVSQQLKEAEDMIPPGYGNVSMGPISTGLGEIFHYTIRADKGYEDKYSQTDLRTIQDWIVRRQLSGTKGIAEVSGWGGFVKQYELAIDAEKLDAFGLTIPDVYDAIQAANENTGGSYIEKNSKQYFIRGLGEAKTIADLEKVAIKSVDGQPILVRDVAEVRLGTAPRFGAVTRNGEGEVVAGITLMLKGENFQEVIADVKKKVAQIQKNLPEGVIIEPFIDRTLLVDRVSHTIAINLVEGALIVIFILVIFLGSIRGGLVVASVIPLSMLFAFGMMRMFDVSGNLMSLGAIDFGLIVDGAVIIVEAISHHITVNASKYGGQKLTQPEMDAEVLYSSSKIRKSAAFGEIIIMMVYIPLFTLSGIEGKMFRPMAMTVFFAILGAFILSLTYVPVASAMFLSKKSAHKRNISDIIMEFLERLYRPVLEFCLRWSKTLIVGMNVGLVICLWLLTKLGGEFIPTLEEGDFAVEISMEQGTSLTQMVQTCTLAEKLLKENFPEVNQAVTRIGSAEIPTDPMPIERADMMIALKPKKEWTSAKTTQELMEKMEETLSLIPGMHAEMSQPIQMRTNELATGVKQDVAIKIFGGDVDKLASLASTVAELIHTVDGVTEPQVERVNGQPQIQVVYDRERLSRYGISIKDANRVLRTAFAGDQAGFIYEDDKRFDIVVRMPEEIRNDISRLHTLRLPLPDGGTVPLSQVADIKTVNAPAQVTHENGERRIYVGFNVKDRDVESTIAEIDGILAEKLVLPTGYYYTYGGQFENLKTAKNRLLIAVPVALIIILILLYATLHSAMESFIVFSAIPLSAIGGILALWTRGLPFSISAGVGFIALFGVAVLNGLVLIGQFNLFAKEGMKDVRERIIKGCMLRLRPVVMTALVASLGFLPMALSHGDGAEVQRPLATVVIGGLVTATILTLLILPAIYKVFTKQEKE